MDRGDTNTWRPLSDDDYTPLIRPHPADARIRNGRFLGAAIDLGTSQIRISLWDRETGDRLAGICGPNPQSVFGTDVLRRLTAAARSEKRALEISSLAGEAVGGALRHLSSRGFGALRDIGLIVIVGNTAMLSLLFRKNYSLLLQPEYWTRDIDCRPDSIEQWKTNWGLAPDTVIDVVQPLGGFVGSDLLAGVLAVRLTGRQADGPPGALFLDFGSNSEIALWDGSVMWVTSAAGGPAFEGQGISCGVQAGPGAVCRISPGSSDRDFELDVIGGGAPRGFCGSGVVDGIACLLRLGVLKINGNFSQGVGKEGIPFLPGRQDLVLKKRDVDAMQRAKAAIGAAISCLAGKAGMRRSDLYRVCIAGAFGRYLSIANARSIGLIPDIPPAAIELCGNTALAGCELLLFSGDRAEALASLRSRTRLINLAGVPEFEDSFVENLFLQPMQTPDTVVDFE